MSSLWNFVKRHKNKLAFTGLAVGAGYYAYTTLTKRLDQQAENLWTDLRREQCTKTCDETSSQYLRLLVAVIEKTLAESFNTAAILQSLTSLPNADSDLSLWTSYVAETYSHHFAAVYSLSLAASLSSVWVGVLSAEVFSKRLTALDQDIFAKQLNSIVTAATRNVSIIMKELFRSYFKDRSLKAPFAIDECVSVIRRQVESGPQWAVGFIKINISSGDRSNELLVISQDVVDLREFHNTLTSLINTCFSFTIKQVEQLANGHPPALVKTIPVLQKITKRYTIPETTDDEVDVVTSLLDRSSDFTHWVTNQLLDNFQPPSSGLMGVFN